VSGPPDRPRATVRLQLHKEFRFADAAEIVPYLAALGASHVYASPFLKARPDSTHGYDIVDHSRLNPEIGDEADFERFVATLHAHDMGLVLDFVPNHMGVGGADNPWWLDVLEWGMASPYAAYFDIDWRPPDADLAGKVLLPFLGDQYGKVLEAGELQLRFDRAEGSFSVWYHQHRFPIAPRDYPRILRRAAASLDELIAEFAEVRGARRAPERRAFAARLKLRLAALPDASLAAIDAATTFDTRSLHNLLERQSYRLAFWRVASQEINYRRFFDVNDLAGLRIEEPQLFDDAHRLVLRLLAEGRLQGLRLDHVDGLFDPAGYCAKLQAAVAEAAPGRPFWLLVEKILAQHERLPADWPVDGTTGYEVMNVLNGLFVDPAAREPLDAFYRRFAGLELDFAELALDAKRQILRQHLASEVNTLAGLLHRLARQSWLTRDFTFAALRLALIEVVARFPVYRTYIGPRGAGAEDRRYIDWAVAQALKPAPAPDQPIYGFLHAAMTTDLRREARRGYQRADILRFAGKLQQLTGPAVAKSFEDTALYRYFRLISLNEVGGEPDRFGVSAAAFHHLNRERLREHPFSMLATATHDHKRGEDARARIDVLSEMPEAWAARVERWAALNERRKREVAGSPAPGRNFEYLLYQTLVGSWPLEIEAVPHPGLPAFVERVQAYLVKAAREAKLRTSWNAPAEDYEAALAGFAAAVLDPERARSFLDDFLDFHRALAPAGAVNGLAQTLLKLTMPGVADIYQGCEFWDLSLVDPDNRRPVDYAARRAALEEGASPESLLAHWRDGRIKQMVVARTLAFRRRQPELFARGDYLPLAAGDDRVVGFARRLGEEVCIVAVPRLCAGPLQDGLAISRPTGSLDASELGERSWRNLFTGRPVASGSGGRISGEALFGDFPLALLAPT
jgi:(1->4)-alpha-D-glucan 1-alpha-D-glucosylmutase